MSTLSHQQQSSAIHSENPAAGKQFIRTTRSNSTVGGTRRALGNVSNNQNGLRAQGLKEKPAAQKPRLGSKSGQEKVTDKENEVAKVLKPVQEKQPVKDAKSPSPMDLSAQGDQAFSKQLLKVNDIDKDDKENPQLVSEYVNDIYHYMRELERKQNIKKHYLENCDINGRMRGILVDWLVQVHLRFHLLQETLYLTVAIIDRFLQVQEVSRSKLQLVGVTSMLIASKYEEMYAPEIADFVYITDNAYSKSEIRKMECFILRTLDFNLGRPLPLHFLRRNSKAGEVDANKHTLAKYLMELTIVDYELVHIAPSLIAGAALCLAMRVLDGSEWTDTVAYYSTYSEKELLPIMQRMALLVMKAGTGKLTAIKTKYQSSKFMRISTIPELQCSVIEELAEAATTK